MCNMYMYNCSSHINIPPQPTQAVTYPQNNIKSQRMPQLEDFHPGGTCTCTCTYRYILYMYIHNYILYMQAATCTCSIPYHITGKHQRAMSRCMSQSLICGCPSTHWPQYSTLCPNSLSTCYPSHCFLTSFSPGKSFQEFSNTY